ncbi:MAG: SURF1 family protein [Pseudomonadota bacterium]
MALVVGNRRFAPGVWPTLAVLLVLPAFVWLGNWQLERAAFKRERLAVHDAGGVLATPVSLRELIAQGYDATSGIGLRHVAVRGRYDAGERHVLLEQMSHRGRPGYYVLTPLEVDGVSARVMVNRGWLRRDYAAEALPALPALDTELREVVGMLRPLPVPGLRVASASAARVPTAFPVSLLYPTAADLSHLLGEEIYDGMVLLDAAAPDGFVREWQPPADGPGKHMGYAVQWFSFAATLLVLYLILNFKRVPSPHPMPRTATGHTR